MESPRDLIPQVEAMRQGIDYRFTITLRGFSVSVRPLTSKELVQVAGNLMNYLSGLPQQHRTALAEADAHARETLKLASTSDVGRFDPQITDPMLDRMTSDEIRFLLKEYVAVCDRVNPCLEKMSDEEVKLLVEAVKKNPSQLTELSSWAMENVCRVLISGD